MNPQCERKGHIYDALGWCIRCGFPKPSRPPEWKGSQPTVTTEPT